MSRYQIQEVVEISSGKVITDLNIILSSNGEARSLVKRLNKTMTGAESTLNQFLEIYTQSARKCRDCVNQCIYAAMNINPDDIEPIEVRACYLKKIGRSGLIIEGDESYEVLCGNMIDIPSNENVTVPKRYFTYTKIE